MASVTETIDQATNWKFLDEPLYRWFMFLLILGAFAAVQNSMLRYMRS